jgi:tetratricopeptide (TPR) repeat protein
MQASHKKRAIFGVFLLLIGAGTVFLLRLRPQAAETALPAKSPTVQDNPDHELKELGVQLEKKPGHFPVLMRMAQIERDQGKLADAEAHLRQAATSEPARADVHLELGRLLYEKGDKDEALRETQQALTIDPKYVDALYNLGAIYANAGNLERARSNWESALALEPNSDSGKKARDGLAKLRGGR